MMRRFARQCLVNSCALLLVLAACLADAALRLTVLLSASLCSRRHSPIAKERLLPPC